MSRVYTYIYHKENQPNIGDYTWVVVSNIFYVHPPLLGEMIQFHYFQMDWHQELDTKN